MTLSVIIPAYGRRELLIRCLLSLKNTTGDNLPYEVCIVDDGSGLNADDIKMQVGAGSTFIWKSLPVTKGRSAARNKGIQSTSGDIVVFLDADMEVEKGFLEAHRDAHIAHLHTAFIGRIRWPETSGFHRYIGTRGIAKLSPGEPVPPWYFVTGNASIARDDLPGDSPFDESLEGWGGEDLELGLKLAEQGVAFMVAPDAAAYHHFDGTLAGHYRRTFSYGSSALPVLVKRYPRLESVLRLDMLRSPLWRTAVHPLFSRTALALGCAFDRLPLPDFFYDYLTFSAYARGWLEHRVKRIEGK